MEEDFRCKIIPNLINESQARSQMEELINDSRNIIGNKTADEMLALTDNAAFFTATIRYVILSDHEHSGLFSPELSDTIQNSRLPSITQKFVGRKNELKGCGKLLHWKLCRPYQTAIHCLTVCIASALCMDWKLKDRRM